MKNNNKKRDAESVRPSESRQRLRRAMEALATFGLILVAVGLIGPFTSFDNATLMAVFKWVLSVGAVVYTGARIAGAVGKDGSFRVRRLRRMEVWAGIAFCIGGFFWFYNASRFGGNLVTFRMLNETILFTLAGALIQIVSSWMLSSAMRKEARLNGGMDDRAQERNSDGKDS